MEKQYKRYITNYGIKWHISEDEMHYNGVYNKEQIKSKLIHEVAYKVAKKMVEQIVKSETKNGGITYSVDFNVISKDAINDLSTPVTVNFDSKI